MNQKTSKALRRAVRKFLGAIPVRELVQPTKVVMVPAYGLGLNLDGTPKMVPMEWPLPAFNNPKTQRGVYRAQKRVMRRLQQSAV